MEFGRLFEGMSYNYHLLAREGEDKGYVKRISKLIDGAYVRINGDDYIQTSDGRRVPFANTSSGQQEALPLVITLIGFAPDGIEPGRHTLFIEEPEAHLYPSAQREVVHLLSSVTDLSSKDASSQYVITTHSPYILSALNNLMYGEQVSRQWPGKRRQVMQILGNTSFIDPANVRAYAFSDGRIRSIISEETGLVKATVLDSVSNELAKEFDALVDIEFAEEAA